MARPLKVLQLNYSDNNGGAARAAYRIHHALRDSGIDSQMLVNAAASGDWTVQGPTSKRDKAIGFIRPHLVTPLRKLLHTGNPIIHSPALVPSRWPERINSSDADLVHLHWVQAEMLSIADISRISKPIVWTMHDMWAFCGAEHYTTDLRWRDGYRKNNRPIDEKGFDLNRYTWNKKTLFWNQPFTMIGNCSWISECARGSALMSDWPIHTIPNSIDISVWKPLGKSLSRQLLNLPSDVPLCLFSSFSGLQDQRKGIDLLLESLDYLDNSNLRGSLEIVVLANKPITLPSYMQNLNFKIHFLGPFNDDLPLALLYNAVDVVAIPSRQETLTNVGVEAHACGCPVVAYRSTGLLDIVTHRQTGYLAKAFDTHDFGKGLYTMLSLSPSELRGYQSRARKRAEELWSNSVVANQLIKLYSKILLKKPSIP